MLKMPLNSNHPTNHPSPHVQFTTLDCLSYVTVQLCVYVTIGKVARRQWSPLFSKDCDCLCNTLTLAVSCHVANMHLACLSKQQSVLQN